jgi:hypothetical protein
MVVVLAPSAVYCGLYPRSEWNKDYIIGNSGICAKPTTKWKNSKDWLAQNLSLILQKRYIYAYCFLPIR